MSSVLSMLSLRCLCNIVKDFPIKIGCKSLDEKVTKSVRSRNTDLGILMEVLIQMVSKTAIE